MSLQHPATPPRPRPGVISSHAAKKPAKTSQHPVVRVFSGLRQQVAKLARSLVGTRNRLYYRANPRLSCASFVSTVLVRTGGLPKGLFTRSASQLAVNLRKRGAVVVVARSTRITAASVGRVQAGDLIMFQSRSGRIKHCGIAVGNGRFVAISSARLRVVVYDLAGFRRVWPKMQVLRLPNKGAMVTRKARRLSALSGPQLAAWIHT